MTAKLTGKESGSSHAHPGWIAGSLIILVLVAFAVVPGGRHLVGRFLTRRRVTR
jgi:hypothetical protein